MHVSRCWDRIAINLIHKKLLWCVLDTVLSREMTSLTWPVVFYVKMKPWVVQFLMKMHACVGKRQHIRLYRWRKMGSTSIIYRTILIIRLNGLIPSIYVVWLSNKHSKEDLWGGNGAQMRLYLRLLNFTVLEWCVVKLSLTDSHLKMWLLVMRSELNIL